MGKRLMTTKQWLIAFFLTALFLAFCLVAFNYATDPFGAFGDAFMHWWDYDMTMNPRVAKISYLEQNHEKYDSYIIGCSSTSSYPVEQLNEYYDASFYNMIMYGADLYDVELMSRYLAEHYEVKNLIVNLYIHNAEVYNDRSDSLTYDLHCKVDGTSRLRFYSKYLFANPRFGATKIEKFIKDGYVQSGHDVFDDQTGAYDKSRRDVEHISDFESYVAKESYKDFIDYPKGNGSIPYLKECMNSLKEIKSLCEKHGINLTVVCPPMYHEYMNYFSEEEIAAFNRALAQITDYWDFTMSSISFEPRYFYDNTHFRNCVGEMAVAKMATDQSVYMPEDFGHYVTQENVEQVLQTYWAAKPLAEECYTAKIPILMYHHLDESGGDGGDTIDVETFDSHMQALKKAGYHTAAFSDLLEYVEKGKELPPNTILITFDDGYESNLTLAYPILKKYEMRATVFPIGVSIGKDHYKESNQPIIPHFSLEQAKDCLDYLSFGSHGYDAHEASGFDAEPIRKGILQKEGESEADYIQYFRKDCATFNQIYQEAFGERPQVFAYPGGNHSVFSEILLREEGYYATVTSEAKSNTVIKGIPQSLRGMGRYTVRGSMSAEDLLNMIQK